MRLIILGSLIFLAGLCSEAQAWGFHFTSITPPATYADGTAMNPDVITWYNICVAPENQVPTNITDCTLHTILYTPPASLSESGEISGRYCVYGETVVDANANHPVEIGTNLSGYTLMTNSGVPVCHTFQAVTIPLAPSNMEADPI